MKQILTLLCLCFALHSGAQSCDSLRRKCDSLQQVVRAQNFRVNRVKFYLNICLKNPKQDKFLKGWIRRAVK